MSRRPESQGRARGFTLFETLVALAVCGVAVAAIAPVASANLGRARLGGDRLALVLAERGVLETLPARDDMREGIITGNWSGIDWRMESRLIPEEDEDPDHPPPWIVYRIMVDFSAPGGLKSRIETIRLGRPRGSGGSGAAGAGQRSDRR